MRHLKNGRKLKRTASHRKALLNNLATSLLLHKRIQTTEAKAKELRPFVEKLITKAKKALVNEQNKTLSDGQTIDVHSRRVVGRYIKSKAVVQELFDGIAPVVEDREGGYIRIIKTGTRHGDGSRTAIIELVDWSESQDGRKSFARKKKKTQKSQQKTQVAEKIESQLAESISQTAQILEESIPVTEQVPETEQATEAASENNESENKSE